MDDDEANIRVLENAGQGQPVSDEIRIAWLIDKTESEDRWRLRWVEEELDDRSIFFVGPLTSERSDPWNLDQLRSRHAVHRLEKRCDGARFLYKRTWCSHGGWLGVHASGEELDRLLAAIRRGETCS